VGTCAHVESKLTIHRTTMDVGTRGQGLPALLYYLIGLHYPTNSARSSNVRPTPSARTPNSSALALARLTQNRCYDGIVKT
jgi:hypothetical protein